jgi:hypothetical protein
MIVAIARRVVGWLRWDKRGDVGYPIRAQPSIPASLWGNVGLSPNLSPNRAANDR